MTLVERMRLSAQRRFNGSDYDPVQDNVRLSMQMDRIKACMLDGKWRTQEIQTVTHDPPASISAQLRHLRKKRFGSYTVDKKARGDRERGLFEYRLLPPGSIAASEPKKGSLAAMRMRIEQLEKENMELREQIKNNLCGQCGGKN